MMGPQVVLNLTLWTSAPRVANRKDMRRARKRIHTDVGLDELSGLVSLDVGGLTDTTITDEDALEFRDLVLRELEFSRTRRGNWSTKPLGGALDRLGSIPFQPFCLCVL